MTYAPIIKLIKRPPVNDCQFKANPYKMKLFANQFTYITRALLLITEYRKRSNGKSKCSMINLSQNLQTLK